MEELGDEDTETSRPNVWRSLATKILRPAGRMCRLPIS